MHDLNLYAIPNLICAILALSIGLFVIRNHINSVVSRSFFILAVCSTLWQAGTFMVLISKDPQRAYFWSKAVYLGAIFIPVATYHFTIAFLDRFKQHVYVKASYIAGTALLLWLCLSKDLLDGVYTYYWGYWFKAAKWHPVYLVFFSIVASVSFINLLTALKEEQSAITRLRIYYLLSAFAIAYLAAVDFLADYGIAFYPFGYLPVLAFIAITAYAIVKHQLMDIEVIIKKTLVFAGVFGFVFSVIVVVALVVQEFIAKYIPHSRYLALAISAGIIVLLQQPVYSFLVNTTNKYLFQKKYDLRKILKEFSDEVLTILNLDRACKVTVDTLTKNLYLVNSSILLLTKDETGYEIHYSSGLEDTNTFLKAEDSIISYFKKNNNPLLYQSYDTYLQASDAIKQDMDKIKSQMAIPLVIHDQLVGILSLGAKKSDEPYTVDDVEILTTLVRAVSVAISNARLFAQAAQYEKLATIGTLASGINHEVCNPLNNISAQMQIFIGSKKKGLFKDKKPGEIIDEAEKIMDLSINEIQRVAGITSKLSSFAKPSKDSAAVVIKLSNAIEDALDVVGHELKLNNIEIVKDIPEDIGDILADEHQIQQIFFNLIRNAAQAIKEEGTITISAEEFKNKVDIKISDTGCGMSKDQLARIFEPFYTTKDKGSGFGLSIVRELVWRNNGSISVDSEAGKGTTFYMEFVKAK